MHVLVTGGAGFIGSHLSDYLVSEGHKVTVVDSLISGDKSNLNHVINDIDFYEDKIELFNFSKLSNIDSVVHLASQVSVPISVSDFGDSSSGNLLGTIKVIDFCRCNQVPLVYASSSAVYGNLEIGDDTNLKVDLLSPYAADKYVMELYAKLANQLYQLSSIGLRFYNVYGPRQDPDNAYSGVISIFSDRLLSGKNITVNGGYQTRDFVYVKDIVKAINKAILSTNNGVVCEQINVLSGQSISIDNVADMLIDAVNVKVDKLYKDLPIGDPKRSVGSTEKMQRLLGIDLDRMVTIESGLKLTIESLRR